MSVFDLFDGVRYEKKLRKIKEEHFQRVADLEDKIHGGTLKYRELDVKFQHDVREMEQRYKLEVQELVSRQEKELDQAKHKLEIREEKFDVEKQKLETVHERKLGQRKIEIEKEVFERLTKAVEREGKADKSVVEAQRGILKLLTEAIPNVNWDRQDGSPKLAIEHKGTPEQTVNIRTESTDKPRSTRRRTRKRGT